MGYHKNSITGKFKRALEQAGFYSHFTTVFNDRSKRNGKRRLKLWGANAIFNAPQWQQCKLEHFLREAYGDDILSMYFVAAPQYAFRAGSKSLCIRLKK